MILTVRVIERKSSNPLAPEFSEAALQQIAGQVAGAPAYLADDFTTIGKGVSGRVDEFGVTGDFDIQDDYTVKIAGLKSVPVMHIQRQSVSGSALVIDSARLQGVLFAEDFAQV